MKSVEIVEVNDVNNQVGTGRETVGGRYIFHHMIWGTAKFDENGERLPGRRCPGRCMKLAATPTSSTKTPADCCKRSLGGLRFGAFAFQRPRHHGPFGNRFRFHPRDYQPKYQNTFIGLGNGVDISIAGNEKDQELHAYTVLDQHTKIITFEPHLHAPGERMCLEAIWGYTVETLSCVGYDHNWVRGYPMPTTPLRCCPKAPSCTSSVT